MISEVSGPTISGAAALQPLGHDSPKSESDLLEAISTDWEDIVLKEFEEDEEPGWSIVFLGKLPPAKAILSPKCLLSPSKPIDPARIKIAQKCHHFALSFLKDYILVSRPSVESPKKPPRTPLYYLGKSLLRVLGKPAYFNYLVNCMPEGETGVPVSSDKTTLRVLQNLADFFSDYQAAQKALPQGKTDDATSKKSSQAEEILLIEWMNKHRSNHNLDPIMSSAAEIDKYLKACLSELFRVIRTPDKNPDSSPDLMLDALLDEVPNVIFDHITFLLSPYFICVLIHHMLIKDKSDKAKEKEADSIKASPKSPQAKPAGDSKKETAFDRELGIVLNDLIHTLIKLGEPSALLGIPLKSGVSFFKNQIAALVHLEMDAVGGLESLGFFFQTFTHFLWEGGNITSSPTLVPYFYKEGSAKEAVIKEVHEESLNRINALLMEVLPFGTQWFAATDFTKTLSQKLFTITQQPCVLKFMVATILEGIIELNKGNIGTKLLG